MASYLNVNNLKKEYVIGDVVTLALQDVSVEISKGEFICIEGPSGSGKSTFLNCIGLLDRPSKGTVNFMGNDVSALSDKEASHFRANKIGFIFQSNNSIDVFTVYENVEYPLLLSNVKLSERREKTMQALNSVGIAHVKNHKPNQISGGQCQRMTIARALVTDPELIIADEPTANLDSKNGIQVMEILARLNREKNITIIFSSHDTTMTKFASKIIRFHDGNIMEIINQKGDEYHGS
jgi:putative ABC transport system ATP-binding protein